MESSRYSYINLDQSFDDTTHVIVYYHLETDNDVKEIASSIARESSLGLFGHVSHFVDDRFLRFAAQVVSITTIGAGKIEIKVAYPLQLFECDNIPQLLSLIAGNGFGIRGTKYIKVVDVAIPGHFTRANKGPAFGVQGIREMMKVYDRPLVSSVVKPKIGLTPEQFANAAYEAWVGGIDMILDDENITDQEICPFYERVNRTIEARRKAEDTTGERKIYFPNVSARLSEMYARAKYVREMGGRGVLVDILTVGFSGVQFLREQELGVIIHGHRSLPAAYTQLEYHGVSMLVIAKIARLAGIDQLHTGTVYKKDGSTKSEILAVTSFLSSRWEGIRPTMPFESGGITADAATWLHSILGRDIILNAGGAVFENPGGIRQGAKELRRAVEVDLSKVDFPEKKELSKSDLQTYKHSLVISKGLGLSKIR